MIKINDEQIKKFERDLLKFKERAYPFATKQSINNSAFKGRDIAQARISSSMILKNQWTRKSIQVQKCTTLNVNRQYALLGSTLPYMEVQEFGGVKTAKGSEGTPIATAYASGQQANRTKLATRANRLANIKLKAGAKRGMTLQQKNLIAIREARTSGTKMVFLDLGKRKGIFKVIGSKKFPKIRMLHDLTRKSVRIPARPWLHPSIMETQPYMAGFYRDALEAQLRRHGLFRWL